MKTCPHCQNQNEDGAKFCDRCGETLPAPTPAIERSWLIGADPGDDGIRVDAPTVSGAHCRLTQTRDGFVLEDLNSINGTFVNDRRINQPTLVTRADRITLGSNTPFVWPSDVNETPSHSTEPNGARVIRIGREEDNDVVLDFPMISWHHAQLTVWADGRLELEDLNSTNGTFIGSRRNRVKRGALDRNETVYFGSYSMPAARLLPPPKRKVTKGVGPHTTLTFSRETMTLGRDPECDHPLDYPMVSWRHARLSREDGQVTVEDLGSTNGTFVNGQRITGAVVIEPGDVIGLGSYSFTLTAAGQLEKRDYRCNLKIEAQQVTVAVKEKRLIEAVSLTIFDSELVGLMGPSGAGKTTLMNALNGYTAPAAGAVLFNRQNLYAAYDQFRGLIGYVPQDDIMHGNLTVRQALYYTARLRLPSDYTDEAIEQCVNEKLKQLGLTGAADVLIGSPEKKGISGGQRKRVNLAMELLTDPSALFLDEPTSGLSSPDALMVMRLLRQLADDGKTILITIHQPSLEVFRLMNTLVVVGKDRDSSEPGRLAYFGPAHPDSLQFFELTEGESDPTTAFNNEKKPVPTAQWVERYQKSEYQREFVQQRAEQQPDASAEPVAPKIKRQPGVLQWWTLAQRYLTIKARDTWNTLILLAQAPIIAVLIALVFEPTMRQAIDNSPERWQEVAGASSNVLFLMAIAALWFGCSNAAREIVGEWAIYRRERMVSLKIPSYVASKFAVLGGLCLLQCLMLLSIVTLGCELKGAWWAMLGVLLLVALVGTALGLLVSALAKTSEVAIALVPLILIPMVVLGGAMQPRHEMSAPMKAISQAVASRWAYEGLMLLETERRDPWPPPGSITKPQEPTSQPAPTTTSPEAKTKDFAEDWFPKDKRSTARECALALGGMLAALLLASLGILKLRDIH